MKRKVWTTVLAMALFALFGGSIPTLGMSACAGPTFDVPTGGAATTTSNSTTSSTTGTTATQSTSTPTECAASVEVPCMRYHTQLVGNPSTDVALRNKYIAAFGDACYMSEAGSFGCFYQKWQDACDDAAMIGLVSGNAPYEQGYDCQPDGAGNYTLQIGPDVANVTYINYQAAPRQTPLIDVNGTPTAVNGPYRDLNLPDPADIGPGNDFYGNSGKPDGDGGFLLQKDYILQVNKNANDGGIRSDLAGYQWPCTGADGGVTTCTEVAFLDPDAGPTQANVHHVVPMKDKRCCPWGTNSYKNAAVISRTLNAHLTNDNPTPAEVTQLNDAGAYTP